MVTALNKNEWQRAKNFLDESLVWDELQIPDDADFSFESSDFNNFKKEQEKNKPLKITSDKNTMAAIVFVGIKENVVEAKISTDYFLKSKRIREHEVTWKLSENKCRFVETHFSELEIVKKIENDFKVHMKLEPGPQSCIIRWKGLSNDFDDCKTLLEEANKSILEKDEIVEFPGVEQLFTRDEGQKQIKLIQEAKKVFIRITASSSQTRKNVLDSGHRPQMQKSEFEDHREVVVRPKGILQDIVISLQYGRIENQQVGLLNLALQMSP